MTRSTLIAVLLLAGCAGAQRTGVEHVRQVDHGLPAATEFPEGQARDAYAAAHAHEAKGDASATASVEQARPDWAAAAEGYAALAVNPAAVDWQIPLRHRASELFLRAQRFEKALEAATALGADAHANDVTKAVAARLNAAAALGAANAAVKAGQLERLDLTPAAARKDGPRQPPAPWKRVVDAADAYVARAPADPEARKAPGERRPGIAPADLALVAAEVQFAYGDLDGARTRLEALQERWPSDAELLEQSVPLYLATYGARDDRAGHDAAVDRLRARVSAEAAKATAPKEKAAFARVLDGLGRARIGSRFSAAEKLLADGKAAEAAQAFEALAQDPAVGEPANALHNAGVAWEKAGDHVRAAAAREKILKEHPGSPVAPGDALALAAHRSRSGDHAGSARLYEDYLQRWPDSQNRCLALRNVASELDVAGRATEAAVRYAAFGRDDACAKADAGVAASALVRAGTLFEAQARSAYTAAAALSGGSEAATAASKVKAHRHRRRH